VPSKGSDGLCCSFCGKTAKDVKHLVEGTATRVRGIAPRICDECLSLCSDIVAEEMDRSHKAKPRFAQRLDRIADALSAVATKLDQLPETKRLRSEAELLAQAVEALAEAGDPS
jgi:ATP-dependent protease Clp ATPase subunit